MENNQNQPTNGASAAGKPGVEGAGKPDGSAVGVFDQLMKATIDHVLNVEEAVRENTAQLRVMGSSVELVRDIPKRMTAMEQRVVAMEGRVGGCMESMGKLSECIEAFEQTAVQKLGARLDIMDITMRQLAVKPIEWGRSMEGLTVQLQKHAELFEKPQEKRVYHRHYLHYYAWIIVGLGVGWALFAVLWHNAQADAERNAGNDILWRGAWQVSDSAVHAGLVSLKYQCDTNGVQFRQEVEEGEEHDAELTRKLKEQNLKQQEADEKKAEADEKQQEADAEKKENEELKKQKAKH